MNPLVGMLTSKKFIGGVAGTLVAFGTRVGLDLPIEDVILIISPLMIWIGAQGFADIGKHLPPEFVAAIVRIAEKNLSKSN